MSNEQKDEEISSWGKNNNTKLHFNLPTCHNPNPHNVQISKLGFSLGKIYTLFTR